MAEAGEFNLIVAGVESDKIAEASRQFSRAFSLDETVAQQICKAAPIVFAQKLTKSEVKAISPALTDLSRSGMEFRVTARVAAKLPKVNWPVRPQFTAGGASGVNGLAFEWDNNAFVCPGCGETFLFRRLGQLALADAPEGQPTNGSHAVEAKASAPVAKAAEPAKAAVRGSSMQFADEAPPAPQLVGVEGVQPLAGEAESLDLPEAVEEVNLDALPDSGSEASSVEDLLPEAPAGDTAPAEELSAGEFSEAAEELAPEEPAPSDTAAETSTEEVAEEAPVEAGELYNVFLSKITDTSKRDKAAELISKVKGCSTGEAKELTTRLVIPLAKNVPKAKAEDILNQFKKLKIFGRMTKVK
jgi:hypothetical protein